MVQVVHDCIDDVADVLTCRSYRRATFFGNANDQVAQVCEQLGHVKEIVDSALNPSGKFDAIGFSQGELP